MLSTRPSLDDLDDDAPSFSANGEAGADQLHVEWISYFSKLFMCTDLVPNAVLTLEQYIASNILPSAQQYIAASVSAVDNIYCPPQESRCFTFLDNVFQPISNRLEKAC